MDPLKLATSTPSGGLPRLRGDGPQVANPNPTRKAAAPPTRGWTPTATKRRITLRGCPAYAGMDPRQCRCSDLRKGLPRLRGDGPRVVGIERHVERAAPPTRGWTRSGRDEVPGDYGCPAYAGMDPLKLATSTPSGGLPRLRGDGPKCKPFPVTESQAAPPTRGWTLIVPYN